MKPAKIVKALERIDMQLYKCKSPALRAKLWAEKAKLTRELRQS